MIYWILTYTCVYFHFSVFLPLNPCQMFFKHVTILCQKCLDYSYLVIFLPINIRIAVQVHSKKHNFFFRHDLIGNLLHWFKRKLTVILTFLSPYNFQDTVLSSTKICDFIRTPGSIIISNLEIVKRSLGNFRQLVGGGAGMHPHLPAWNSWIPSPWR